MPAGSFRKIPIVGELMIYIQDQKVQIIVLSSARIDESRGQFAASTGERQSHQAKHHRALLRTSMLVF